MLHGKFADLYKRLKKFIPEERLLHRDIQTLTFGTDASFYRLQPQLVVKVHNEQEAQGVIRACYELNIPLTTRASGTSLSGQAISDSVLMQVVSSEWRHWSVNAGASEISVQPGLIGGRINQLLAPYRRKIGPEPASINAAQIGGIVSNNASGMSGGIPRNSYHTLVGLRLVLSDGFVLDTRDEQSRQEFMQEKKELAGRLADLATKVKQDAALKNKIVAKFAIKNTCGYGVNALIDYDDPVDILAHLMVGAEGTLGFISDITLKTLDDPPAKAAALVFFPDIATACESIAGLRRCSVAAAELMDRASLHSVQDKPAMPDFLKSLDKQVTALLVETRAENDKELQAQIAEIRKVLKKFKLVRPVEFTTNASEIEAYWQVRKGLFPSVCAARPKGTTVIIEDIAVPYKNLAATLLQLQDLFAKYRYDDAIIWGHALDGNVHFVLIQDFSDAGELKRYQGFIDDLAAMVLDKYDGSLKAEHGTGRNMAPFVRREWGDDIYAVMKEIKQLFDPTGIMNPGVLINDDPQLHLKNLKSMPAAHDLIDACIECGFCEVNCLSRDLTLSPRQRIVAFREISELSRSGREKQRLAQLRDGFEYQGNQTCATDGLCALSCPVGIDTGLLIKELRHDQASERAAKIALKLAENMDRVTATMRFGLGLADLLRRILGSERMMTLTGNLRKWSGNRLPQWTPYMPAAGLPAPSGRPATDNPRKVVYFSSCITRSMGPSPDYEEQVALTAKTEQLLRKAGFEIIYPPDINNLCCGMAFASKGYKEAGQRKADELNAALLRASDNGRWPVLVDMSPCHYRMKETLSDRLHLYEPIEFTLKFLKDRLEFEPVDETIIIHTVCSAKKMNLAEPFEQLARLCAREVQVADTNCCGFAGDRGFTVPELNASGLKYLKEQVPQGCSHGYSTSRTCEIGLSSHSGISFKSILYLVDACTRPLS